MKEIKSLWAQYREACADEGNLITTWRVLVCVPLYLLGWGIQYVSVLMFCDGDIDGWVEDNRIW